MTENLKPLTKAQVVTALAEELALKKTEIAGFFDALTDLAYKETKKKGAFVLPGFGKLIKDKRKARLGRNPATGAEIKIPAKTVVKFRLQKSCKDAIVPAKK